MKTQSRLALAALAAIGLTASAQAQLLFFEDFSGSNFVTGNSVAGVTSNSVGALGQNGTWAIRTGATATATITSTALSYTNGAISMTGSGKAVTVGASVNNQTVIFGVDTILGGDSSVTPADLGNGNSLYFSVLWRLETGSSLNFDATSVGLITGSSITGAGVSGYTLRTDNGNPARFAASNGANVTVLPGTTSNPVAGTTYLLVGRVGSNGTAFNTFDMWINPSTSDGSDTPYLAQTGLTQTTGISASFFSYAAIETADVIHVGEFRVGSTWADAVAIPEPSSLALLAGALGGLALLRRRRQA